MINESHEFECWFTKLFRQAIKVLLLITVASAAYLSNVPQSFTQPDGSLIKCFATGDENYHWLHDSLGYTIIQDSKTGYFVYARLSDEGLRPTLAIPGIHDPRSVNLLPNNHGNPNIRSRFLDYTSARDMDDRYTAPTNGMLNNIVIFIRFNDQSEFTDLFSSYTGKFNDDQVSLQNYYLEASYSQLEISTHFYPTTVSNYPVSYQDLHPRAYYSPYNAVTNTIGYPVDANGDPSNDQARIREHSLLKNAVLAISSQIPSNLNIDGDNDGLVDNVCFIVQGGEDGWSDLLWPHMWVLWTFDPYYGGSGNVLINGKTVWTYNLNLSEYSGNAGTGVGVLAHEMFHSLGAPDLYHYSYDGFTPAGSWDLMQSSGDPPHHMTAYMKYRYGNWISSIPEILFSGTYSLDALVSSNNNCFKIQSPNSASEYFVLEYREKTGLYETTIPGTGLIVYRINTLYDGQGNSDGPPDELYIFRPNGSTTSNGIINDAHLSASVGRTEINDFSNPAAFLTDGGPAGLDISQIGFGGDGTIQFHFDNQSAPVLSHFELVYSGNPYLAMNIYATSVTLEGMDLVTGDEVGIYDGEFCVGAGVVVGVIDPFLALVASTDDPGTPEIDGFTPGHAIAYRLWDASEGAEISNVNSSYSLGNGLFTSQGTAMVDLVGMTQVDMNLALESGWNIMSFYANPDDLNLLNVVQPLIGNGSLLKIQDETGSAIENLPVIGWVNNIGDMSVSEGYYIKMAAADNLNLIGTPVELPFTLTLNTGWNIMGYPLTSSQNALAAVQSLIDGGSLIKVQDETGAAIEELPVVGWINNIGDLTSGKGYYVKVSMDTDITLDNQPALARAAIKAVTPGSYFELLPSGNPYLAMNIYVMNVLLDEVALGAGTEIGVFDGDLCVGSAQLTQTLASELDYLPLVIGTDDPSTEEIDGFTVGHNVSFRIWTGEKEQTIAAVPALEGGTVAFTPQGSMVVNLIGATVPDSYTLYDCYPNPFNPSTTISYDLPLDSHVQLVIYDVLGREIRTLISRNERAGSKAVIWDGKDNHGRSVSSGIYPVRFQAGNYMKVKKALFIK